MDDLVAELTLRVMTEMNGNLDAIRENFSDAQEAAQQLGSEVGELDTVLAELRAPEQLASEMAALEGNAVGLVASFGEVKTEIGDLPAAIQAATTAADLFGTAVDQDKAKIDEMVASWKLPAMIPPEVTGEQNPAFIPPGVPPPPPPAGGRPRTSPTSRKAMAAVFDPAAGPARSSMPKSTPAASATGWWMRSLWPAATRPRRTIRSSRRRRCKPP